MTERYNTLFKMNQDQYEEGCPVALVDGALYRDMVTDRIVAQFKMRNIGARNIISCAVSLRAYAVNGTNLEGVDSFSYLDMYVKPGEEFGEKVPVFFPDKRTRGFSFRIKEIYFEDGTSMQNPDTEWKQLPDRKALEDSITVAKYAKKHGIMGDYMPENKEGLFLCTCGGYSLESNETCCMCGRRNIDCKDTLAELVGECSKAYDKAIGLMSSKSKEDLRQAIAIFDELEGYKDSDEKKNECKELRDKLTLAKLKKTGIIILITVVVVGAAFLAKFMINLFQESSTAKTMDKIEKEFGTNFGDMEVEYEKDKINKTLIVKMYDEEGAWSKEKFDEIVVVPQNIDAVNNALEKNRKWILKEYNHLKKTAKRVDKEGEIEIYVSIVDNSDHDFELLSCEDGEIVEDYGDEVVNH